MKCYAFFFRNRRFLGVGRMTFLITFNGRRRQTLGYSVTKCCCGSSRAGSAFACALRSHFAFFVKRLYRALGLLTYRIFALQWTSIALCKEKIKVFAKRFSAPIKPVLFWGSRENLPPQSKCKITRPTQGSIKYSHNSSRTPLSPRTYHIGGPN